MRRPPLAAQPSFALAALALVAGASRAEATIMVPLSVDDMALRADAVIRGHVVNVYSAWNDSRERIFTFAEIEVTDRIFSKTPLDGSIVVRTLGGEVGDVGMKVSGTERFAVGEDILVFLRNDGERFQVVGMSQGKYRVARDAGGALVAIPSVEGLAFARPGPKGIMTIDDSSARTEAMPFDALRARILRAISREAAPIDPPSKKAASISPATPAPHSPTIEAR